MKKLGSILKRRKTPSAGIEYDQAPSEASLSTPRPTDTAHYLAPPPISERGPLISPFPDGVKTWHDCEDATLDICFIHGLTGNRDGTWTAHGHNEPWPKALLPSRIDKTRILTYGYDAYIARKSVVSENRLIDHATNVLHDLTAHRAHDASFRPIIIVAHSLGGLIWKEAILLSRNNPETHLQSLFDCNIGIIFLGTPHRGSWMADWAQIPASALGVMKSMNTSLLKILSTDDQLLESLQTRFWNMVRERQRGGKPPDVTCFFEELPMSAIGKVVSKQSATLEGYNSISIHANHRDMVRFASEEDTGFKRLLGELIRWQKQTQANNLFSL
jgi:hypothetical protein